MEKAIVQQVQKRMLLSITSVARQIGLKEGDYVKIEVDKQNKELKISPVDWHEKDQSYFWTEAWQKKMQKSMEDLEEGRVKAYSNMDDLIKELENDESTKNG